MSDGPFRPDGDPADLDYTQPSSQSTRPLAPPRDPVGRGHVQRSGDRAERRSRRRGHDDAPADEAAVAAVRRARRRVEHRRDSGLYLPAWSVMLMLVAVFAIAGVIVAVVVYVGGNPGPGGEPRVLIITAVPSDTPAAPPETVLDATAAPASENETGLLPTFALEGPLLPTVALTPTPTRISVGAIVEVINVAQSRLNVRAGPGTSAQVLTQANQGDRFEVVGGPETTNESGGGTLTWWQLRSLTNSTLVGWAVENDGVQDVLAVTQ